MINCPNCGAPIDIQDPDYCAYCGTSFFGSQAVNIVNEIEKLKSELNKKQIEIANAEQSRHILYYIHRIDQFYIQKGNKE